MKKKILINASCIKHSNSTGVAKYALKIIDELITQNDENFIFTIICFKGFFKEKKQVKYIYINDFFKIGFLHIFWNTIIYSAYLLNFDLGYSPASYGSFISKKQVITIHDLICFKSPKKYLYQYIYLYLSCYIWLKFLKVNIIAISETTREEIFKSFGSYKNVNVVYNGLSKSEKFIPVRINYKYFLIVGAEFPHKNTAFILSSYSKLSYQVKQKYKLVIVSKKSNYHDEIRKLSSSLNLENNVIFKGYVSDNDLQNLYSNASLFLVASKYEGFGFTPYEALSKGCDVLISDIGIFREVYKSYANYFSIGDEVDFNNKINFILENKSKELNL